MNNATTTDQTNTGDRNSGNRNSGNRNSGDWNSGDLNSGDWNSGDQNSGSQNPGDLNSGDLNSGNRNSGNWNSGNWNSGNWNSGNWNSGNWNSGYFNRDAPGTVRVFEKEILREEFEAWDHPSWLYFPCTEWVAATDMTEEEKTSHPEHKTTGGFLRVLPYKEAFQQSYNAASREDQLRIKECPGFDPEIFFDISGIRVDDDPVEELTLEQVCAELGRNVKIIK